MLTSPGPLPLGSTDPIQTSPIQTGSQTSTVRSDSFGVGASEPQKPSAPIKAAQEPPSAEKLRTGETSETTDRKELPALDSPTGPPPAFLETLLERAERLGLEEYHGSQRTIDAEEISSQGPGAPQPEARRSMGADPIAVPPSRTEKALMDFATVLSFEAGRSVPKLEMTI